MQNCITISNDVLILATTLHIEAEGEPHAGKRAVADVIFHRAKGDTVKMVRIVSGPRWNGVYGVQLLQKRILNPDRRVGEAWQDCVTLALGLKSGYYAPSLKVNLFCKINLDPAWKSSPKVSFVCNIKNHDFFWEEGQS